MRKITGALTKELIEHIGDNDVRKAPAFPVKDYRELMQHVARLAYANKDYMLFFRGQRSDKTNKAGSSTFYPSIYRGERISKSELEARVDILSSASKRLVDAFEKERVDGAGDVRRRKYIQWSILQHYEVCATPLLDFSQSVRVACSFAFLKEGTTDAYVFVFGLPYVTNRISVNSEHDIVNIRLLSICPPDALRPYYQEGYLAGSDEFTLDFHSKEEFDFNARLIAKFRIQNSSKFWNKGFSAIPEEALYPRHDKIDSLCKALGREFGTGQNPGQLGLLIHSWVKLESDLLDLAKKKSDAVRTAREAISVLSGHEIIDDNLVERIDRVRRVRNRSVHRPEKAKPDDMVSAKQEIDRLVVELSKYRGSAS